jgi:hypothetical protein
MVEFVMKIQFWQGNVQNRADFCIRIRNARDFGHFKANNDSQMRLLTSEVVHCELRSDLLGLRRLSKRSVCSTLDR